MTSYVNYFENFSASYVNYFENFSDVVSYCAGNSNFRYFIFHNLYSSYCALNLEISKRAV